MHNRVVYNKLVRDKIPDILDQKKKDYSIHIAGDEEYREKLHNKLQEEVQEFLSEPCIEELADVYEVLSAISVSMGFCDLDIHLARAKKISDRGAFKDRYILESVSEE